jgi:5-methylcytosine-specific restriction endonuclease McrA
MVRRGTYAASPKRWDAGGNRVCPPCGALLTRAANARRYPVYCSASCDPNPYAKGKALPIRLCRDGCGRQAERGSVSCLICPEERRHPIGKCHSCGASYRRPGQGIRWRFCSVACQRRVHRRNDKRRAMLVIEKVHPVSVFQRDGWTCHLCGDRTERPTKGEALRRYSPTLDHLVPVSHGGEHSYANVRTAHMVCNSKRGARAISKSQEGQGIQYPLLPASPCVRVLDSARGLR